MEAAERIAVEVVYALPRRQHVFAVTVASGATVATAVRESGVLDRLPELVLDRVKVGIFGRRVGLDHALGPGDRIEVYRELIADPKTARRARAEKAARKPKQPTGWDK